MGSTNDEVVLEIENTAVICNKEELIANSDYFRAMFEGNFVERSKDRIKLEVVDLKGMNIILNIIWDESYIIPDQEILKVLHTACMLQFMKIKNMCVERITEILHPRNCIKIWLVSELLDIRPLHLQAKMMALEEFLLIKDTDCLLEFTLDRICHYLGHIYLKTDSEITVFQTIMRWWYESSRDEFTSERCQTNMLLKLFNCIDFSNLTINHINEIMVYPDIVNNADITEILSCILSLKNKTSVEHFSETCQKNARLLCKSQSRIVPGVPCILVLLSHYNGTNLEANICEESNKQLVCYDKYKPKRLYQLVNDNIKIDSLAVVYYDSATKQFKKLFTIDAGKKCNSLDGFELMGYKEFVFLYGGEYLIGKGNWNKNFWVYDTIRDRWERKSVMPYERRHFQTCLVGEDLYVIGGAGSFRVIYDNMFSYNYKNDEWSDLVTLPCTSRQLKCCSFLNKLFILSVNDKCGFIYDQNTKNWLKTLITMDNILNSETEFGIFSYKNKLYIKGKKLIELEMASKELIVTSVKEVSKVCDTMKLILCDNIVYTFYQCTCGDSEVYSLEAYNLDTDEVNFVFKDVEYDDAVINVDGYNYVIGYNFKLLSFQHWFLAEKDSLVNDCFV